jgi:hypothetical protein
MEHPDDILLWPDGSWYFRSEVSADVAREAYRVIASSTLEWRAYNAKRDVNVPLPSSATGKRTSSG